VLTDETTERGKVRPPLRVAALVVGLFGLPAGAMLVGFGFPHWEMVLLGGCLLFVSAFYIYVGATGSNFDAPKC
jgi:hypothetical protein